MNNEQNQLPVCLTCLNDCMDSILYLLITSVFHPKTPTKAILIRVNKYIYSANRLYLLKSEENLNILCVRNFLTGQSTQQRHTPDRYRYVVFIL